MVPSGKQRQVVEEQLSKSIPDGLSVSIRGDTLFPLVNEWYPRY